MPHPSTLAGPRFRSRRAAQSWCVAAVALAALTGCDAIGSMSPNLAQLKSDQVATSTATTAAPSPSSPVVPPQRGDLAAGSKAHVVHSGSLSVVFDYWSKTDTSTWNGTTQPVVNVSAHVQETSSQNAIKATRVRAVASAGDKESVLLDDAGEFVLTPPFNYATGYLIPKTPEPEMTVTTQIDLLVETAPKSGQYFRQTVFDTLNLTFNGAKS